MALPVKRGVSAPNVGAIPDKWDANWFRLFVTNVLQNMDPRNSTPGPGMQIQTNDGINTPATLGPGPALSGMIIASNGLGPGAINPTVTPAQATGTDQGVPVHGNIMPMVQSQPFSYTSTASSIDFTWPSFTVYRPDGVTTVSIGSGGQNVTGLSSSTTYFAYAYSTEANPTAIQFVTGLSGAIGTPAICFPSTATYAQLAAALAAASTNSGYFQGKLTGITPASGSGGGGGGGGGYGCPHPSQMVMTEDGTKMAAELKVGDKLMTPTGWSPILTIGRRKFSQWIQVKCNGSAKIIVTPDHRFREPDGQYVRADGLHLNHILAANGRNVEVTGLSLVTETAQAVSLELASPHEYLLTRNSPVSHNLKP